MEVNVPRKKLEEILSDEQIQEVLKLAEASDKDSDLLKALKMYFLKHKEQLETKGIYHDYLAWAVYHAILTRRN
tara:strand:+ start:4 stop:225 length:222 start_codon:yes stop_codon:yes gene_type:complete